MMFRAEASIHIATMSRFKAIPSEDNTMVEVTLDGSTSKLNAVQLENLLACLIEARSKLLPEVPRERPRPPVVAQHDPMYWTSLIETTGDQLLMIRHLGLGWLSFLLPAAERDRLAGYFEQARVARVESEKGAAAPNEPLH